MAKQQYLKGTALYDKFLSGFAHYAGLNIISRNDILHISIDGHEYYIIVLTQQEIDSIMTIHTLHLFIETL